nr:MAG TPA: hypothetical protein [Bacteriophage sp.]
MFLNYCKCKQKSQDYKIYLHLLVKKLNLEILHKFLFYRLIGYVAFSSC